MARKKPTPRVEFVLFDVLYEDGTQSSNRKVAALELAGLDGDDPALTIIAQQDDEIAQRSGRPRGPIKSIVRSGAKPPSAAKERAAAARKNL
ncbi:MAG TPA: hypothetical protein VMX97_11025 [Hyphomicrobiaceae bacterium]|nr:hypothetical protein [Hyphomicrobiaceae bacterium]